MSPLSEPKPSLFQVLAPELIIQICSDLDDKDLRNLLPTCKYLHTAVSGYLYDEANRTILEALSEARTSDFMGIEFSNKHRGGDAETTMGLEVLIQAVENLLKQKDKPIIISFKTDCACIFPEASQNLLLTLKAFSYTRPASQFSINTLSTDLSPAKVTRLFDVRKLTKLNITFNVSPWSSIPKGDQNILDASTAEYKNSTVEELYTLRMQAYEKNAYGKASPQVIGDIVGLNKLLMGAHNLEHLQLNPVIAMHKRYLPLDIIPPELEELKETFSKMKKLRSLELGAFLFHLSILFPIPENVERLFFKSSQYYSKSWWMQFAKYKFANLKELRFDYNPSFREYHMYDSNGNPPLHRDNTLKTPDEIENGYKIGSVEITTLERFFYDRTHNVAFDQHFSFPTDLVRCITKKNESLDPNIKRSLANRQAEETVEKCRARLLKAIESCRDTVRDELVRDLLEGDWQDDGNLEKCLSSYVRHILGKPQLAL
ncbi:hypothetical protein TWF730_009844 [Orbilia blumenaviensis]|uniref:F-box domain-containing protein n=1 Tax=Orbilia blumenaviensis TaxID=1796055 RepID=A0AAV9UT78_9PEZI